jgi:hypothetical protein
MKIKRGRVIPLTPPSACDGQPPLIAAWLVGFMANPQAKEGQAMRTDVYERVTNQIVAELEKGVRPWLIFDIKELVALLKSGPSMSQGLVLPSTLFE